MRPTASIVLTLAAFSTTAALAESAGKLTAVRSRDGAVVRYGDQSLRTTPAAVSRPRVIVPERSSKVIALWDETNGRATEHYYALSLDGGRTFPLVLPTT